MTRRVYTVVALAALAAALLATPAAARLTFFQSPAENVHCVYLSTKGTPVVDLPTVRCDTDFPTRFRRKPANCEFDFGGAFQVTSRSHGRAICVSDSANSEGAAHLKVGVERHFGPFTCKSAARNAVRCTSARGHGFFLSPRRQLVY